MAKSKKSSGAGELFIDSSGQLHLLAQSAEQRALGRDFPDEETRHAQFRRALAEKLREPAFREIEGFPDATDDDILAMSDPPYHTACPNPFLGDFVQFHGRRYDPEEPYFREPFAVDVSVGKTDPLYKAHAYHTKVPHLAIVPSILHYTSPGDVVLDGFCGSGMTGVATQWCNSAPGDYRRALEEQWKNEKRQSPVWGPRRAILNDLSPAATFIAAGYNLPFDLGEFAEASQALLHEVEDELGWMWETLHKDGTKGRINYVVWSEVGACPDCSGEIVFAEEAVDRESKRVRDDFPCPHCKASLTKRRLERSYETRFDATIRTTIRTPKRKAVLVNYDVAGKTFEKVLDPSDFKVLQKAASRALPSEVPAVELPYMHMTHERARLDSAGITHLHHFYLPRAALSLASLWSRATAERHISTRRMLIWFVEQAIWGMSVLARYAPTHFSQVNQYLNGVYYVGSQIVEVSPWYILEGKLSRLLKAFRHASPRSEMTAITTGSCAELPIQDHSVDYIFTDPPFGENIYYADLNFLVESWHRVRTNAAPEAIIDRAKNKHLGDYQDMMRRCFAEYCRVLKPGRWMTVVFHNSSNAVWNAVQEALLSAGFVVADVRTLDKQQGSYRQITSTAVKQDLVISAYKPNDGLEQKFRINAGMAEGAWDFVRQHLLHLPVFVEAKGKAEMIAERQPFLLFDRMVAFHIQRGATVPLNAAEFYAGLRQRFPDRDGMYFLPEQVPEYDRRRLAVEELSQLVLFVDGERSAIQWLRQELERKPQTYQQIQPKFLRELHKADYEHLPELRDILQQNFLEDDLGRWYVPDPNKQIDLEKLREKALLREFEEYKAAKKKLKMFRTEALRAGFKAAWAARDYQTIVSVAQKLPEDVVQEDQIILMYYDNASMRIES